MGFMGEHGLLYATEIHNSQLKNSLIVSDKKDNAMISNTCEIDRGVEQLSTVLMTKSTRDLFVRNVKLRLQQLGLSQKELANRLGRPAPTVSRWLSGKHTVDWDSLDELATALEWPVGFLFIEDPSDLRVKKITRLEALRILAEAEGKEIRSKRDRRKKPETDEE